MNIEWCVCDMDGTLLDSRSQLSAENIQAIQQLHAAGVEVVLATGRSDLFVKDVVSQLGVTRPIICCNGGMIRGIENGDIYFSRFIDHDIAGQFVEDCIHNKRDMLASSPDCIYYLRGSQRVEHYHRYNNQVRENFRVPLQEVVSVDNLPTQKLLKFFVCHVDDDMVATLEKTYNQEGHLSMVRSQRGALDIMAKGISKGEALLTYAQLFGMDLAKTVVFGDHQNDISMFLQAGYPIAVGNAEQEVKEIAKYITRSNDESGVAYAIHNYIINQE